MCVHMCRCVEVKGQLPVTFSFPPPFRSSGWNYQACQKFPLRPEPTCCTFFSLFSLNIDFNFCLCVYICVQVSITCVQVPMEAWRGRWVSRSCSCSGCEEPDVDAGIWTQVLCKSSKCFKHLRHHTGPSSVFEFTDLLRRFVCFPL